MDKVFDACVDILYFLANSTGLTYKQINVIIFCILWPILTIFLFWKAYFQPKSKQ